ncbi:hypothetical protein [Streptomonospora wellingtoniae]|uniref:Uncharacterized protein n=1 Tax=Streptomonospora wellingtoniae TaxID=3075544 RepID=A0ABU2KUU7_9ACTN|nr:hypothetical protein [Streptomonospora sp. DSM 45055]MDT0303070.1 hypothetical protein [Streptomonospora sp. DSM 45055]
MADGSGGGRVWRGIAGEPVPRGQVATAAAAGALWPAVLAVSGAGAQHLFWRAYSHTPQEVAWVVLFAAAVPLLAALAVGGLLRRRGAVHGRAASAAALLSACPAAVWSVWGAWQPPGPASFALSAALSAGVFVLIVHVAQRRTLLRWSAAGSALALLVLAAGHTAAFLAGLRSEAATAVESADGTLVVLDHPHRQLQEVWGGGDALVLTYGPDGTSGRELEVRIPTGPGYDPGGAPCAGGDGACERHGVGVLHRDAAGRLELLARSDGTAARLAAPFTEPSARRADLLEAGAHLRPATRAERGELERLAFRGLLRHHVPALAHW